MGETRRARARRLAALVLLGVAALGAGMPARADEPASIAVFDFELVDTSLEGEIEGPAPEELARLELISEELRAQLEASGQFRVIDPAPLAAEIEAAGHLRSCNGCEVRLAERLGAELALVGWVQKVSDLILNINVAVREVATREPRLAASVDIRGNTDESWLHGVRYLVRNRLLKGPVRG